MDADESLDTIGLLCPLPVLKARKALQRMAEGQILRVTASDPAAIVDIPHFCVQSGHAFLGLDDAADGTQTYYIQRGGQS